MMKITTKNSKTKRRHYLRAIAFFVMVILAVAAVAVLAYNDYGQGEIYQSYYYSGYIPPYNDTYTGDEYDYHEDNQWHDDIRYYQTQYYEWYGQDCCCYYYWGYASHYSNYMYYNFFDYDNPYDFEFFEYIGMLEVVDGGVILHPEPTPNPYGITPFVDQILPLGATWVALQQAVMNAPTSAGNYPATPWVITVNATTISAPLGVYAVATGIGRPIHVIDGRNVTIQSGLAGGAQVHIIQNNHRDNILHSRHFIISESRLTLDNIRLTRTPHPWPHNADYLGGGVQFFRRSYGGIAPAPPPLPPNTLPRPSTLYLTGGSIIEHSRATGGAIITKPNSTVILRNAILRHNSLSAILAAGGNGRSTLIEMHAPSQIYGNRANGNGGGISLTNQEVQNHPIHGVRPAYWGEARFVMRGGTIGHPQYPNVAGLDGGGVRIGVGGRFYMYGGTVHHNYAQRRGGGIAIVEDSSFIYRGGAIRNNGRNLAGTTITQHGGGVEISGGGVMDILPPAPGPVVPKIIEHNHSLDGGGGIFLRTMGATPGVAGIDPYRTNRAARINFDPAATVIIQDNHTNGDGGGILIENNQFQQVAVGQTLNFGAIMTMSSGTVRNNHANNYGGGIALRELSGDATPGLDLARLYVLSGALIDNNTAANGGGIASFERANVIINGGTVRANSAEHNGGGVYINNSNLQMQSGTIGDSHAGELGVSQFHNMSNRGGGVFVSGPLSRFGLSGGLIAHNRAAYGGGVYVTNGARGAQPGDNSFHMSGSAQIRSHWRTRILNIYPITPVPITRGGGVLLRGQNTGFVMAGGTIGGEQPTGTDRANQGGGVAVLEGARFQMMTGTISGNVASWQPDNLPYFVAPPVTALLAGGGVFVDGVDSAFYLTGGVIGGLPPNALPTGAPITTNLANSAVLGSGVAVANSGTFVMDGGTITGNDWLALVPGRMDIPVGSPLTVFSGGGVFAYGGAHFNLVSGHIVRNRAGNNGGGVSVATGATVHIQGGYLAGNQGGPMGGAINISSGGAVVMDNGTIGGTHHMGVQIEGNRASTGGGINVVGVAEVSEQGGPTIIVPSTFILNSGVIGGDRTIGGGIMGNHATASNGGAMQVIQGGWVHVAGGNIRGNYAPQHGGGAFVSGMHGVPPNATHSLLSISGGVIGGPNAAADHNIATLSGGAVRVLSLSRMLMTGGHVLNNRSPVGAGIAAGAVSWVPPVTLAAGLSQEDNYEINGSAQIGQYGLESRLLLHYHGMNLLEILLCEYENYYGYVMYNYAGGYYGYAEYYGEGVGFAPLSNLAIPARPPMPVEVLLINGANAIIEGGRNLAGGNTSATLGGGVLVTGGVPAGAAPGTAAFRLANGIIRDNRAVDGAGVLVANTGTVFLQSGGHIGGAGPFAGNTNSNVATRGGGVNIGSGATFDMQAGDITGNNALNGGGVFVNTNATFITRSVPAVPGFATVEGNQAIGEVASDGNGGGVFISLDATVTLGSGTRIRNNRTSSAPAGHNTGNGGGIYTLSSLTIGNGVVINGNEARRYSPGEDAGMGGGVYARGGNATNSMVLTMTGGEIHGNSSERFGGGVAITSGANNVYRGAAFIMSGGEIHDNEADRPEGRPDIFGQQGGMPSGGGVSISRGGGSTGGVVFEKTGGIIHNNRARSHGSGVCLFNSGTVDAQRLFFEMDNNALIQYNHPFVVNQVYGGGVSVRSNSRFTMNGGTIRANRGNWGSAINNQGNGQVYLVGGTIGGTAVADGNYAGNAAIFNNNGRIVMSDGYIIGNRGSIAGGIFNAAVSTIPTNGVFMSGGRISNNTAGIAAGGGYVTAAFNGGGGVRNLGQFRMSGNAIISNNTSIVNGGGVWTNGSGGYNGFWMSQNAAITGNTANGNGGIPTAVAPVRGGGGVYVAGRTVGSDTFGGRFEMEGGIIGGATAALANHALTSDDEEPSGGGGVVAASGSEFIMHAGRIEGNISAHDGGGVLVHDTASFQLRGTVAKYITGNEADNNGGGVWVDEDAEMRMQLNPLAAGLRITHNEAEEMGGGIFTMDHGDYLNPLPVDGSGRSLYYLNLTLNTGTQFTGNTARFVAVPPANLLVAGNPAIVLPEILWASTSPASPLPGNLHPINNYDINFESPSAGFRFYKTNYTLYNSPRNFAGLLPGAQFRVFRTTTATAPGTGDAGLVLLDSSNNPIAPWEEVTMTRNTSQSGSGALPVAFDMSIGFTYQLVEVMAPAGFQMPFGQWRIVINDLHPAGFTVTPIGNIHPPPFVYRIVGEDIDWFVGNMRQVELPMSGGIGTMAGALGFATIGMTIIVLAIVGVVIVRKRKGYAR